VVLQAEVHPKVVQERLGHASVKLTLDTYAHVLPPMHRAAAARFIAMVEG
jgi:integrase